MFHLTARERELVRPADGMPLLRTAMRLMPESGYLYLMLLGRAYLFLGDLEQASGMRSDFAAQKH